MVTMKLLKNL